MVNSRKALAISIVLETGRFVVYIQISLII